MGARHAALRVAMQGHCGSVETVYTPHGPASVHTGKDLSGIATVIGTSGVIEHSGAPLKLLATVVAHPAEPRSLRPRAPRFRVDREYLLYACGLLSVRRNRTRARARPETPTRPVEGATHEHAVSR